MNVAFFVEEKAFVEFGVDVDAWECDFELVGEGHLDEAGLVDGYFSVVIVAPAEVDIEDEFFGDVVAFVVLVVSEAMDDVVVDELGDHGELSPD